MPFTASVDNDGYLVTFGAGSLGADELMGAFRGLRDLGAGRGSAYVIYDVTDISRFEDDVAELHRAAVGGQLALDFDRSTRIAVVVGGEAGTRFVTEYAQIRNTVTPRTEGMQPLIRLFASIDEARAWSTDD